MKIKPSNTQFHSPEKEPLQLYYKDFDSTGSIDPIFCYYINGVSYPSDSRDDLADQLPVVKKKFLEYHQHADATINDILTSDQLKDAKVLQVTEQCTHFLPNDGDDGNVKSLYRSRPKMPPFMQSLALTQIKLEKKFLLAGNNSWTRIKFGRCSANHGILLIGDGKGNFSYVPQMQSGLNVRSDVRTVLPVQTGNAASVFLE